MNRNQNHLRKTAILAAAAAAGVTMWTSSTSASETRPADFETEFEVDLSLEVTQELPDGPGTVELLVAEPAVRAAVIQVPSVVDEWECCAAVELVAPEATMEGWSLAVADYLDQYLARPADEQQTNPAEATQAAAAQPSSVSAVCEFCLHELQAQEDEKQLLEEIIDFAAALRSEQSEPQVSTRDEPVGWQVLTQWTIARFEARTAAFSAIDPSPATGGEDCFRLPAGEEFEALLD
jgi:hypothetical protein